MKAVLTTLTKKLLIFVAIAAQIAFGSEMTPNGRVHVQIIGNTAYVTSLSSCHDSGMSMIPAPNKGNKNQKVKPPPAGTINNPRWSGYKESDYRNGTGRKARPKMKLELNCQKNARSRRQSVRLKAYMQS